MPGRLRSRAGTDGGGRCLGSRSYFRLVGERAQCPWPSLVPDWGWQAETPQLSTVQRWHWFGKGGRGGVPPQYPGKDSAVFLLL